MNIVSFNKWKKGQEEYPLSLLSTTRLLEEKVIDKNVLPSDSLNFKNNSDSFVEVSVELRSILLRIIFAYTHKLEVYVPNLGDEQGSIIQYDVSFMSRNFKKLGIQNTNKKATIIDPRKLKEDNWTNIFSKVSYSGLTVNGVNLYCSNGELEFLKSLLTAPIVDNFHDKVSVKYKKVKGGVATPYNQNFKSIETANIDFKKYLISSNKFKLLDNREHFLLDLPLIMWRLGWYKGGITLANWIYGKGTEINNSIMFDFSWFKSFDRVIKKINAGIQILNEADELSELFNTDTKSTMNNYNALIDKIKTLKINEKIIYGHFGAPTDLTGDVMFNVIRTEEVGSAFGFDQDELEAACGRFRISFYGKFEIHRISQGKCNVKLFEFGYRAGDSFDFSEDQVLGFWKYLILNPEMPSRLPFSNEEVKFTDSVFRNFFDKVYPTYKSTISPKTNGYRNNNDFLTFSEFEFKKNQPVNSKVFEYQYG